MNVADRAYLDNAATTAVDPRVLEAMLPYFGSLYGNPSSVHQAGVEIRQAVENARQTVAEILLTQPKEILFTSCGTESDNLALRGVAWARRSEGKHLITTTIEHHAVGHTCEQLAKQYGFDVTYVPVDRDGLVDPADIENAITEETTLVSIMMANNEVGTIEPIAEIARLVKARGITFHTDAVQAGGQLPIDVDALNVDLLSLSGHKIHAPKGIGVLFIRRGTPILPTQTGGGQEFGMRAGTENVPYIIGMARALELAYQDLSGETQRVQRLRDRLIQGVLERIPDTVLTGHPTRRLPNNASFLFKGIDGEGILLELTMAGVAASTGSACASGEEGPSYVLLAMGYEERLSRGSLRLTLSKHTTDQEIDHVLSILPGIIERLRAVSPFYSPGPSRPE